MGTLQATGLDDGELDAAVCLDAIFFTPDRIAALREVRRVLRPGGRFLFTADERARTGTAAARPGMDAVGGGGGSRGGGQGDRAWFASRWKRRYALWLEHLDEIRALHGEHSAATDGAGGLRGRTHAGRAGPGRHHLPPRRTPPLAAVGCAWG